MLLSTIHGLASLRSAGMIAPEQLPSLVDDSIAHFLHGTRTAAMHGADAA
jgi:hypothetical protein